MQPIDRSRDLVWLVVVLVVAFVSVALTVVVVRSVGSSDQATAAPAPSATLIAPQRTRSVPTSSRGIPATERPTSHEPSSVDLATTWTPPADLPQQGRLLHVAIPGTRSHFVARDALLWLPPAALVADPPPLPVTVLMSGQSRGAGPDDVETGGHIAHTMDAIAGLHRGLAPIVVVPDQLGPRSGNPMCVDGPLGNSRTYLEQDVPAWITSHLRVQTGATAWTVGGFSQGGTCAIQLGAGDPQRFGNVIDVSGELGPTELTRAETLHGFGGSVAAWRAAQPIAVMAQHGPYTGTSAFFTAAQLDRHYGPAMPVVAAHAAAAGMHVTRWVVPGGGHDWAMARAAIAAGMAWLEPRVGLAAS